MKDAIEKVFYIDLMKFLMIISIISVVFKNKPLNLVGLLDFWVFITVIFLIIIKGKLKLNSKFFKVMVVDFLYIYISFIYIVLFKHIDARDFFISYKSFIYILPLCFLTNDKVFSKDDIVSFSKLSIIIFSTVYSIEKFFLGDIRPQLITENNFELPFLIVLLLCLSHVNDKSFHIYFILTNLTVLLSFSLSGTMEMLLYDFYELFLSKSHKRSVNKAFKLLLVLIIVISACYVVSYRIQNINQVDRYTMVSLFFKDISFSSNSWINLIVGKPRITYVPDFVASSLSYYKSLFSYTNPDKAFSVIYHIYLLRIIYDHGIIGLMFLIYTIHLILKETILEKRERMLFIIIYLINGLSVSGFNNIFFILSLLIVLFANNIKAEKSRSRSL